MSATVGSKLCSITIDAIAADLYSRAEASPSGLGFLSGPIAGVTQSAALSFAADRVMEYATMPMAAASVTGETTTKAPADLGQKIQEAREWDVRAEVLPSVKVPGGLSYNTLPGDPAVLHRHFLLHRLEELHAELQHARTVKTAVKRAVSESEEIRGTNAILAAMQAWSRGGRTLHNLLARSIHENGAESAMESLAKHIARRIGYDGTPIDMLLFCPMCNAQHVDAPEPHPSDWDNPPHRSHKCHACDHIWRPSDSATNGVHATNTAGKCDGSARPYLLSVPPAPVAADPTVQQHAARYRFLRDTGAIFSVYRLPGEIHVFPSQEDVTALGEAVDKAVDDAIDRHALSAETTNIVAPQPDQSAASEQPTPDVPPPSPVDESDPFDDLPF